jgi:hypothetical protein
MVFAFHFAEPSRPGAVSPPIEQEVERLMRKLTILACVLVGACSGGERTDDAGGNASVTLRNLANTDVAAAGPVRETMEGDLVPTPSDPGSRYYVLRQRRAASGNIVAILRQERGERTAYARTEVDCAGKLFHVLGVGRSRAGVEVDMTTDGPLRPIAGLPLRQELARYVCQRGGTPLT